MDAQRVMMIACLIAAFAAVDARHTSAGVPARPSRRLFQEYYVIDSTTDAATPVTYADVAAPIAYTYTDVAAGITGEIAPADPVPAEAPAGSTTARTVSEDGTSISVENNPSFNVPGNGKAKNDVKVKPNIINVTGNSTAIFLPFSQWPFPLATAWTKFAKKRIKNLP